MTDGSDIIENISCNSDEVVAFKHVIKSLERHKMLFAFHEIEVRDQWMQRYNVCIILNDAQKYFEKYTS